MFVHAIQSVLLNNEVQKLANLGLFWSDNVASFDTLPTHQYRAIKSQHEIKTDLILGMARYTYRYRSVLGQIPNVSDHPYPIGVETLEWAGHVRAIM